MMVQYIFYVEKIENEQHVDAVRGCATAVFGTASVAVQSDSSCLIVELDDENEISQEQIDLLVKSLEDIGFYVSLPPSRADVAQDAPPLDEFAPTPRKHRVPLSVFFSSLCAVLVLSILATYTLATQRFDRQLSAIQEAVWDNLESLLEDSQESSFEELELLKLLFEHYAVEEIDEEKLMDTVLKAYAMGTGDVYAQYYTQSEFDALMSENMGEMDGIGVSVANDRVTIAGVEYGVLHVIRVYENSPALEAGLRVGDLIYSVLTDKSDAYVSVESLGYDTAISSIRGTAGTQTKFIVIRFQNELDYEVLEFSITRAPIVVEAVSGKVLEDHPDIGLVEISSFDLTAPTQFKRVMNTLIDQGCEKFIFDLRYNPGGDLLSVEAVLSTLLEENDLMITTLSKDGTRSEDRVSVSSHYAEGYEGCSVSASDIGKYRGYEFAVIVNKYTASAAELFAANLRDYELATLVGDVTYGKGCMQSTFLLDYFGYEGALKLTTAYYLPPSGENYHGKGIAPDVQISLDRALIEKYGNVYLIPEQEDTQVLAAIAAFQ